MCKFDYEYVLSNIEQGNVSIRIMRSEESNVLYQRWEGTLDLTQGSGSALIDDSRLDEACFL